MNLTGIKTFFAKAWIPITAITVGAIVLCGTGIFLYNKHWITLPASIESRIHPTPLLKDQIGAFIILPHEYSINDVEKQLFIQDKIKTVFIIDGTDADKQKLSTALEGSLSYVPQFYLIGSNTEYKKCNITSLSDNSFSANTSNLSRYELTKGECNSQQIVSNIIDFECKDAFGSCQKDLMSYLSSPSSYLYIEKSPFTKARSTPTILTEQKAGTVIITWNPPSLPYNLSQRAYSLEYLDANNKRIISYGQISGSNQGDYFLPPTNLKDQTITIKLRVWYNFKNDQLPAPEIYTGTFSYKDYQTPVPSASAVQPVEMAWIPDWGMADGLASVKKNPKKWHTISPTWYIANDDGSMGYRNSTNNGELTKVLRANGVKLVPTIALFDADVLKKILRNNMQKHIDEIVYTATIYNYDGIDLDYESTYLDDKELLTQFVTELAARLHEKGKILIFTAAPKIDDRQIYSFLPQTHQAQDWKALGAVVDEFRIMAYDYTGQTSLRPGPLSPLPWDETIIQYAVANIPANKVVLALPIYSHAWPKPANYDPTGVNNDASLNSGLAKNTMSWQHDDITYIKAHSTYYNESSDSWYGETHALFKYKNIDRDMYYLSPADVQKRLNLAKAYGIKGLCYWRIGGDQL